MEKRERLKPAKVHTHAHTHVCAHTHTHLFMHICSFVTVLVLCLCAQSCLTLCNPMDYSPPGSSVRGILQTGILQWVAISFSRRSSQPRDQTCISCIAGRFCITETPGNSSYINLRKVSSKYPNEVKSRIKNRPKNDFL